jgi:nucleotide-binding universal stress UspA family protein/hemerythrin superfamily protein
MKRILIALDASPAAEIVLRRGVELAATTHAKVRLLRVIDPVGDTNARLAEAEAELLAKAAKRIPSDRADGIVVEVGAPVEGILRTAERYNADTIVIGARGESWGAPGLGGTATEVARRADRPVHVVRPLRNKTPRRQPEPEEAVVPPPAYAQLEAAALSGVVGGAVAGAFAGPPGAILGGTLGLAAGTLAGSVLEMVDQRASRHDRELDAAIGVTEGTVGAPEQARRSFAEMEESLAARHRDEHRELETLYASLVAAYQTGDWGEVGARYAELERALRAHLEHEEVDVFPSLGQQHPDDVAELLADHTNIRARLDALAMGIELHIAGLGRAEDLVQTLRAHSAREERVLYPWLTSLSPAA